LDDSRDHRKPSGGDRLIVTDETIAFASDRLMVGVGVVRRLCGRRTWGDCRKAGAIAAEIRAQIVVRRSTARKCAESRPGMADLSDAVAISTDGLGIEGVEWKLTPM